MILNNFISDPAGLIGRVYCFFFCDHFKQLYYQTAPEA